MRLFFTLVVLISFIFVGLYISSQVRASQNNVSCDNRYVTLVNPVRGRSLWTDNSLKPIQDQYNIVKEHNFSATWLLQYDNFSDKDLMGYVKGFDQNQEKGIFLEVSKKLTDDAKVFYPTDVAWFKPNAVFLSGYSHSDRKKLIDQVFKEFKDKFGVYPQSVGAWWIDSYSLNYLKQNYHIKSAMIVADQKTTDNYGVWGQWWGVPYYPTKANILEPALNEGDAQKVAVIQWAQRDPLLAYGSGPSVSNYSLQANDYIRQGKDTNYFKEISSVYLDCQNPIGQITVGLETGQESVGYIDEYKNQLDFLKTIPVKSVTMSQFGDDFSRLFNFSVPISDVLTYKNSVWTMNASERRNLTLGDHISYSQTQAFPDYFLPDHQQFLQRDLSNFKTLRNDNYFPWFILIGLGLIFYFWRIKKLAIYFSGLIFAFFSFGLVFLSHFEFGYIVFYGPKLPFLEVIQILLILISILVSYEVYKFVFKNKTALFLLPLAFFIDPIIRSLRYSNFSGKYYFGLATDTFHLLGISLAKPFNVSFINQDFSSVIAGGLLKLDFNKIWGNQFLALMVYPMAHILVAIILFFALKKIPFKFRLVVLSVLAVFAAAQLVSILNADPRVIEPLF